MQAHNLLLRNDKHTCEHKTVLLIVLDVVIVSGQDIYGKELIQNYTIGFKMSPENFKRGLGIECSFYFGSFL